MDEDRDAKKPRGVRRLVPAIKDISVSHGRSYEPFISILVAEPENVAQESLGTLVGVFMIDNRKDDSAYVVNALSATAKREYFLNPRRGAIASFESMLRRLNIALAETVKAGQVSWVGSLSGIVAVIEQGNLHLSLTGRSRALLFRGGSFLDIGEGLASEEAAFHPLKTFVEISSGRLSDGDCLLFSTPELFEVLTFGDLERNARRLIPENRFPRYVETVMVNELRIGGALVMDMHERSEETGPARAGRARSGKSHKMNYFGATAFTRTGGDVAAADTEDEHADEGDKDGRERTERPGEIYVRGETPASPDKHPALVSIEWKLEDIRNAIRRYRHRIAASVRDSLLDMGGAIGHRFRSLRRLVSVPALRIRKPKSAAPRVTKPEPAPQTPPKVRTHATLASLPGLIRAIAEKLRIPRRERPGTARSGSGARLFLARLPARVSLLFRELIPRLRLIGPPVRSAVASAGLLVSRIPLRARLIAAVGIGFVIAWIAIAAWRNGTEEAAAPAETPTAQEPASQIPPDGETNAALVPPIRAYAASDAIRPLFLDGKLFVITASGVTDAESGDSYAAPSRITAAAAMDDLDAIFVISESRELALFYPTTGRFTRNDIAIPATDPKPIGTFLTYLYLLDPEAKQVYRYPRAEGGFGEGKSWLTGQVPLDGIIGGAVSENVYLHSGTDVRSFLRGTPDPAFTFEKPATPLTVTALCANPDSPDIFIVLDAQAKRLVVYSREGKIQRQLFHEDLSPATACALSSDGSSIAVTSPDTTLLFSTR